MINIEKGLGFFCLFNLTKMNIPFGITWNCLLQTTIVPCFPPNFHIESLERWRRNDWKKQRGWVRCGRALFSQWEHARIHEQTLREIKFKAQGPLSQPTRLRDAHDNPTFPDCCCLPVDVCIIKGHRFKTPSFKLMWNGMPFPFLQENCALDPFNLHKWLQMYRRCLPRKEPQHGSMLKISERYWINGSTLQKHKQHRKGFGVFF